jgi:signal peptidase I
MPSWRWALMALAVITVTLLTLRWLFSVVTVRGTSMEPELAEGDQLLARRCGVRQLRRGQLVVFSEPGLPFCQRPAWLTGARQGLWVIKRVAAVPGDSIPETMRSAVGGLAVVPPRSILVLGNAPDSRDSRQWGFVTSEHILGVARARARFR